MSYACVLSTVSGKVLVSCRLSFASLVVKKRYNAHWASCPPLTHAQSCQLTEGVPTCRKPAAAASSTSDEPRMRAIALM